MSRKAMISLGVIVVVALILLFLGWLVKEGWKECRSDNDCTSSQYCGADFSCHTIEMSSPSTSTEQTAWILGFSLIIAAIIMKWDTLFGKKPKEPHQTYQGDPKSLYDDAIEEEY